MAIYVTGDCHGDWSRFSRQRFSGGNTFAGNDYVIVAGDFGIMNGGIREKYGLDQLSRLPCTILFCDGNHENFNRLLGDEFAEIDWHGGMAKVIRENVLYLERGYVFEIEGKTFFVFGGASSHDIDGGILAEDGHTRHENHEDLNNYYHYINRDFGDIESAVKEFHYNKSRYPGLLRVKDWNWWTQEMPGEEEMTRGRRNLEAVGNKVDIIVTHCAPTEIVSLLYPGQKHVSDPCTRYLTQIAYTIQFDAWYFGHYHDDRNLGRYVLLYERILPII